MSNKKLPQFPINNFSNLNNSKNTSFEMRSDVMKNWNTDISASSDSKDNTITVYDVIGETFWSDGVTAKRIAGALRAIGDNDVVVNINSPGGDMFEGIAIYNLLAMHPAKVTVNVMGVAASAASIIAMAGDDINMGDGTTIMIHNCWSVVIGNRHDLRNASDDFEKFDQSLADIYHVQTGLDKSEIADLMDAESYIQKEQALELGFATGSVNENINTDVNSSSKKRYLKTVETALQAQGMSRNERREIIKGLTQENHTQSTQQSVSKPSATHTQQAKPCASADVLKSILDLQQSMTK